MKRLNGVIRIVAAFAAAVVLCVTNAEVAYAGASTGSATANFIDATTADFTDAETTAFRSLSLSKGGTQIEDALVLNSNSETLAIETRARYYLLPEEIRTAFEGLGWRIEITDPATLMTIRGAGKQYPWYYEVAGTTIIDLKLILLSSKGTYAPESVLHEMGHFFDHQLTTLDGSERAGARPAFRITFNEEKAFIGNEYTSSTSTEFFAECFKYYIENPLFLQQVCPKTYAYIDNEVNKFRTLAASASAYVPTSIQVTVTSDGRYLFNGLDFSPVFNANAYYNRYPDLQVAFGKDKTALFKHFIEYGIAEGRVGI